MNVHSLFLSCSALRANKAWLLTDLRVTSCLHSAAVAPASVNASTQSFLSFQVFWSVYLLLSVRRICPRAPGLEGTLEPTWAQLLLKAGAYPGTPPKPGVSPPRDTSTVLTLLALPYVPFGPSPAPACTRHPPHRGLGPVNHAFVGPTCRRGCQQGGKGKGETRPFSLSAPTRLPCSIWVVFDA